MQILLNGLQLSKDNSGVQYYLKNLYNGLEKLQTETQRVSLLQMVSQNRIKRILFENIVLPFYLRYNNYNLYHSPNYVLPFFIKSPSVLTIHDLITIDFPGLCQTESVIYFRFLLARSVKKAERIIAVSNTVKSDIVRIYKVAEEKIEVIYHGIDPVFKKVLDKAVSIKYKVPEKYILFVGNIEPKKNLVRLIQAFDLLRKETGLTHKLVIAGQKGWKYSAVFKVVDELKLHDDVIFTGYIPLEDLPALYSMSDLFVFPSLYEGFGIPPLEAMACEVPVLVSNKGALPEITGGISLQVNPYDVNEIAKGMHKLLTDSALKNKTIYEGKEWVKQFTWEKAARKTMDIYENILNQQLKPIKC